MTNKEAIEELKGLQEFINGTRLKGEIRAEAFDLAIKALEEKPQGEREFIEILTQYFPDDLCPYPEFKRKPYYSIRYRENGEEFDGYGTYNIKVLSRYLKDYFFNTDMGGGAE